MSLQVALNIIEEYQALTGQEGSHIDKLCLALKCRFIRSKQLTEQDKITLKEKALCLLAYEVHFCKATFNFEALELMIKLEELVLKK
ncbi:hypothetical protein [Vibrio parahaemolyticus]|uniref:hypothetical protein n=1 Tax=Vibrio parahaemolyticus TaxID=670 RepID=UPI00084B1C3F|nr:hypothetical protein [Vibrio parahaemolyticus]EJC6861563.1 hypothetical protein [Vibrio parahaemolyticus]EJC7038631.1 hypothetical protein [Vibrio parahaemolyticus]ELA8156591.1 hypothetical protein [Vibrio parahaemolyticus]ODY89609.1 hypothetical protein BBM31_00095 [Vibrio parahaemolyticus]